MSVCAPFREIRPLAEGGMATLVLASDANARPVVIKRIRADLFHDAPHRALFRDEARIGRLLRHPAIVEVLDDGEDDCGLFMVLEYVEGTDLSIVLDDVQQTKTPLDVAALLAVALPLTQALACAHEACAHDGAPLCVVHRDVSPGNVLLSVDGDVKLADFGVAKSAIKTDATVAGEMKGKFAYMAPEQTRGDDIDGRADLFALGIILFELVTATRLFDGPSDVDVVNAVRTLDVPAITSSAVPAELARIIEKLLSKSRDDRFQNARDVERALKSLATELCLDQGMKRHVARLARAHPRPELTAALPLPDQRRRTQRVVGKDTRRTVGRKRTVGTVVFASGLSVLAGTVVVSVLVADRPPDIVAIPIVDETDAARAPPSDAVDAESAARAILLRERATAADLLETADLLEAQAILDDDARAATETARFALHSERSSGRPSERPTARSLPPLTVGPREVVVVERATVREATPASGRDGANEKIPSVAARAPSDARGANAKGASNAPGSTRVDAASGAAEKTAGFGKLFLRSEPWAELKIDGVATGLTTPVLGLVIPAGRHTMELTNPHYGISRTIDVDMPSGGELKQSVKLDR